MNHRFHGLPQIVFEFHPCKSVNPWFPFPFGRNAVLRRHQRYARRSRPRQEGERKTSRRHHSHRRHATRNDDECGRLLSNPKSSRRNVRHSHQSRWISTILSRCRRYFRAEIRSDWLIIFIRGTFSNTLPATIEGRMKISGMPGSRKSLYSTSMFL